jgi:hypothetical protein
MRCTQSHSPATLAEPEYVIHSASMMGLEKQVIKRVPFHATRDTLSELYSD